MYISGLLDLYMQRVAYIDGTRCIYSSNNKLFQPVPAQQFLQFFGADTGAFGFIVNVKQIDFGFIDGNNDGEGYHPCTATFTFAF